MIELNDLERLRPIGLAPHLLQRLPVVHADDHLMRVTEVQRDSVQLHDGRAVVRARLLPALHQRLADDGDAVAVGDWVYARRNAHGEWWVHVRVPPANQIARRLHDGRDKVTRAVIVANVDTLLVVMGLDHDFNARRLERYLAFARLAGVAAVVVLSKADLREEDARLAREREARALAPPEVAVLALDGRSPQAAHVLAPWLGVGQTLVLVGSSGAGKSTLANTLVGAAVQDTGGTRRGDGRGRHTTTVRSLHPLPGGACLIDTPGLRTLRLDGDADAVAGAFDDIARLAPQCRFRDCRHDGEPGCAVREALPDARLRNFHKLQREAARDTMSALERKALLATWKARSRAGRQRLKEKKAPG
ncbi:MAG TPA: ribosome small subunit-dependent GTPase A [Burkholderiaceae bacterium]|nr:ribosome small subunit-dependent GTPase A [Burkholderiaceae bacterium]